MDTAEVDSRQSEPLPSISGFGLDTIKKEGSEYHQRQSSATSINVSNGASGNQSNMYSGPPPPYTYPSANANTTPTLASLMTGSETRKAPSDEKEQPHRQGLSLPSIQEAILGDQQYPKTSPISATQPGTSIPPRSHPLPSFSTPSNDSQHQIPYPSPSRSTFSSNPPSISSSIQPRESFGQASATTPIEPNISAARPAPSSSATSPLSPRRDQGPGSASNSMQSQSYQNYPPTYPLSQQRPTTSTVPLSPYRATSFETSAPYTYPQSRFEHPELNRVDETRKHALSSTHGEVYGNSVRRHLDIFDLEASLNGVMEGSGRLFDIARYHKTRAQETRGPSQAPAPMPTTDECDRMLQHHQSVGQALTSMREMLLTQEKNMATQQAQSQRYKATADYEMDTSSMYEDAKTTNGAASDSKKRRARAAPPGRCHSCNRAETPEWRRGPDGARTLCNACGLHYAKLTRKTKNSAHGSSLRPKSVDSPPPGSV